jgi:very-short-patch-repair endonuclease
MRRCGSLGASRILRRSGGKSPGVLRVEEVTVHHSSSHSKAHSILVARRALEMRASLTRSEARLWRELSAGKLGVWFRRQVPLGRFIADFLAPAARLVVEVDGPYHARQSQRDARRDRALRRMGYRVLRLPADLVMAQSETAVARVREALAEQR